MKNYLIVTIVFFSFFNAHADLLDSHCKERNGKVIRNFQCPKSKLILPIRICKFKDSYDDLKFFDGCSGPTGAYKTMFFPACIKHDFCYHREPATNGKSRKYCDLTFYNNMLDICSKEAKNKKNCRRWAKTLYRSLRVIGWPAFKCDNRVSREN